MRKYHVYGIGNALVDLEIEVTLTELERLGIEKGVMTLVELDRHDYLLDELKGAMHNRACGGSAANSVITAAKLGANCFYSCKLANDESGDFYAKDLSQEGVHSNFDHEEREKGVTGKCLVMVTPDADRTMNTFLGISGAVSYQEISEVDLRESEYLYIEGYLVSSDSAREAAIKAKAFAESNQVKVALSLSDPNMVQFFRSGLNEMIGESVDLLFSNEQEALLYTGVNDVADAAAELKKIAKAFAITLGPKGALVYDGENTFQIEANPVEAIDTNGAGDTFAGAFLYAITHGFNYQQAGKLACFSAAELVQKFGPRLCDDGLNKVKGFIKTV